MMVLSVRLPSELRAKFGRKVVSPCQDIQWGESWKRCLEESLDASTFFFPVLTPSYFCSECCLLEAKQFLGHEGRLGRNDVIFPIYYIDLAHLDATRTRSSANDIRDAIFQHQFVDWRDLRFELLTSPQVRKCIARVSKDICCTIRATSSTIPTELMSTEQSGALNRNTNNDVQDSTVEEEEENTSMLEEHNSSTEHSSSLSLDPNDPDITIVDQHDPSSKFQNISCAILQARPGAKIVVRPGVYYENIVIDKPIELIGSGRGPKDVSVHGGGGRSGNNLCTLTINAEHCRIYNLSFRHAANDNGNARAATAIINRGKAVIKNCDFTSMTSDALVVLNAAPLIQQCAIHDTKGFGVQFRSHALGLLEDCDIYQNQYANVLITSEANPIVRRNTIHHGYQSGVLVQSTGMGLIEENDVYDNAHAGLAVATHGSPTVRKNRITRSMTYGGVYVFKKGGGLFEHNDLANNPHGAFQITEKCKRNIGRSGNKE